MFSVLSIVVFFLTTQQSVIDASENVWSGWSSWSACNVYDIARQTRFRKCLDKNSKISSRCSGLSKRIRQCQSCSYTLLNQKEESASSVANITSSGIHATKTAWCVSQPSDGSKYVEISFKNFVQFTGIGMQGDANGYVKKYKIKYSYDREIWFSYSDDELVGNVDATRLVRNIFKSRLVAHHIRVYPTSYTARACFKVQLYGCEYNCGGLITQDAPLIRPPSASEHVEELNCLWRIESKFATKLQLKFPYFKLFCKSGMLDLYDGTRSPNNDENLVEGYCGHSGKVASQIFEGGSLWLHYHTNATTSDIGFNIQVNSFVVKSLNETSWQVVLPNTGYSNIYRYSWIITAPRDNDTIQLTLDYFLSNNTRKVGAKCVADVIIIHHGSQGEPLVQKYCDAKQRKVFTSTNGFLKIKYKSRTSNPNWRIKFSYEILGYPKTTTVRATLQDKDVFTVDPERSTQHIPSNNTKVEASQKKHVPESGSSKVPIIISSVLAVLIATVCLVALVHYLKKRNKYLRKHPYDCSNRPMSHFGDQDATPFINTNLLMWNDSKDSKNFEKPKNFEKSKKSLPVIEVTLSENEAQRLSIIPPEMLKSSSEVSMGGPGNEDTGTLKVSDNFTEECMKLLNNNLSSASEDNNDEYNPAEKDVERYGSLPEADRRSPEVDDGRNSLPEAEGPSPETDKLLQKN